MSADDVTPSAVAKIRDDIASAKARGLQTMLPGDAVESILDALEEAWTGRNAALKLAASHFGEVQRLTAERDAAHVKIPDLTPEDMERVTGREYFSGLRTGFELARSRARVVYPAKDGGSP